ncbi:fluoride efflux transporter CrcB [Kordiimonas marina]|uniref:fluoride efflux transporter CrcB n=1 Tax=Kordiimonas marina TaxID=2872312 RepID=UPI001FF0EF2B|nr:fluoride efflux transporter CrcB [Kordiimonas marina]MCJ9429267.1 fluoride efflux transporter CrcB [Kordiimonas marina]
MRMLFAIAAGGATGALMRHFISGWVMHRVGTGFPFGTFTVNILGSLMMGFLVTAFALKFQTTQELRGFLTVGMLGSLTTFSTYSLETALLIERGNISGAALYALGSLMVGVTALFTGMWLGRVVVA